MMFASRSVTTIDSAAWSNAVFSRLWYSCIAATSVMSSMIAMAPTASPVASRTTALATRATTDEPSLR